MLAGIPKNTSVRKWSFGFAETWLFLQVSPFERSSGISVKAHHRESGQLWSLLKIYFLSLDFDTALKLESANAMECRQDRWDIGFARSIVFLGWWISLLWFQCLIKQVKNDEARIFERLTIIGICASYRYFLLWSFLLDISKSEYSAHRFWKSARNQRDHKCRVLPLLCHQLSVIFILGWHCSHEPNSAVLKSFNA